MCEAGLLSPNRTVDCSIHVNPRWITRGCNLKTSFIVSEIWTISDSAEDTATIPRCFFADQLTGLFPRNVTYPLCFFCQFDHWRNLRKKKAKRLRIASPPKINQNSWFQWGTLKLVLPSKNEKVWNFLAVVLKWRWQNQYPSLCKQKYIKAPTILLYGPSKFASCWARVSLS